MLVILFAVGSVDELEEFLDPDVHVLSTLIIGELLIIEFAVNSV